MENYQNRTYIVMTRFKAGIFLSSGKVEEMKRKVKTVYIINCEDYETAVKKLNEMEAGFEVAIPWETFVPNRLYQIQSEEIYTVIFTKNQIAFVEDKQFVEFIRKHELADYRLRCELNYARAKSLLYQMGADTGKGRYSGSKEATRGKIYKRRFRKIVGGNR